MIIGGEFDETHRVQKERIYKSRLKTAIKLNTRIKHFISDLEGDYALSDVLVKRLKEEILKEIEKL